jgi:hypothetical protein
VEAIAGSARNHGTLRTSWHRFATRWDMLLSLLIFARSRRRASSSHSLSTLNVLASSSARRMIVAALCLWSTAAVLGVLGDFSDMPVSKLERSTALTMAFRYRGKRSSREIESAARSPRDEITDVLVNLAGDRLVLASKPYHTTASNRTECGGPSCDARPRSALLAAYRGARAWLIAVTAYGQHPVLVPRHQDSVTQCGALHLRPAAREDDAPSS